MKALLLVAALFSASALAYNDQAIEDAQETLGYAQSRFDEGTATRSDVVRAELFVTEMKFAAGKIPKTTYCASTLGGLSLLQQWTSEEATVGTATLEDLIEAKRAYYTAVSNCKTGLK